MKLTIGAPFFGRPAHEYTSMDLTDGVARPRRFGLDQLSEPDLGALAAYVNQVRELTVGYVAEERNLDLSFLRCTPNVEVVWIATDQVHDISGLALLRHIRELSIDRPTCRMDVLGELCSLESLYLDDWRPGAPSLFRLRHLRKVGIQKFGCENLERLSGWNELRELWLNAGPLRDLAGIPEHLRMLRLSGLRKLASLLPVRTCGELEELWLDGCRALHSLSGIEGCRALRRLLLPRCGRLDTLEPLRCLPEIEYVTLAEGTVGEGTTIEALYGLRNLKTLIIPRKSGLNADRLLQAAPGCDVRLTRR